VRLDDLLDGVEVRDRRGGNPDVAAVTHDSRAVRPGPLFCCLPGARADGHDFAAAAVAAGAVALLTERLLDVRGDVAQVVVASARAAMPVAAAALFGHPSRALDVIGVTGTNGKTTTTFLVQAALEADGRPTRVLGTLGGARTTPEAPELQGFLAAARDEGASAVAMEVSSHALVQHRADAVDFAAAAFTNLSQDHLDYHGDMASYFEAKARLFEPGRARVAVVNGDDEWGRRLLERIEGDVPVRVYSLDDADGLEVGADGSTFRWRGEEVRLQLGGRFNVSNALCAATVADALSVPASTVAAGLSSLPSVPGRFERVDAGQPFTVIVDYAHTPDGLAALLAAARETAFGGRVIAVFGAGGDRDRGKRPVMGAVVAAAADVAVLTSDNPRSEDPLAIIDEVRAGAPGAANLVVEPDRAAAIALAVREARAGDVVVIAGKGHETGQTVGDTTVPFDDRAVARDALAGARP
jgi:UDP-N-acetylmuramoyl-L-alanyl-D-glutamate--2,6-diaminopimelate ligase